MMINQKPLSLSALLVTCVVGGRLNTAFRHACASPPPAFLSVVLFHPSARLRPEPSLTSPLPANSSMHRRPRARPLTALFILREHYRRILNFDDVVRRFQTRHNISAHTLFLEDLSIREQVRCWFSYLCKQCLFDMKYEASANPSW